MPSSFDVEQARKQFPALRQDQVYFDNAGGSQTLGTVIESITDYLSNNNVQMGASYNVGRESSRRHAEGCEAAARYINAGKDEHKGDELIVSKFDHEANIASWIDVAERLDLKLKWWTVNPTTNPHLNPEDLRTLVTEKTRLVACTHTSNILGTINPIRAIADVVHAVPGAMLCVDGVAYAPHRRIDVKALGVDFYSFSWYKVYGPHIALLYGSTQAQKQLRSLGHYFNPTTTLEHKLGLAAANYELTQSVPRIVEYLGGGDDSEAFSKAVVDHEKTLAEVLLSYLRGRVDVAIYGEPSSSSAKRVPTVAFTVHKWGSKEIVEAVEKQSDYGFRSGHFYSKRLCDEVLQVGEDGVVRVSMVHYNPEKEIRGFVEVFDRVVVSR